MTLMLFLVRILELMFFVGIAGSAVVVIISFVDDFAEIVSSDDKPRQLTGSH